MMPPCVTPEGAATILLAEDDPASSRLTTFMLNRAGYRVVAAMDGEQALRLLDDRIPDLILLDRGMPKLDGLETCRRIKADARLADIPVVFLTAMSDPGECVEGFAAGGVDYVNKPVVSVELLARIRTHIKLARNQQHVTHLDECVADQQGRLGQVRDGQASLLTSAAEFPDLKLGIAFQPAREAGGDFYEIRQLSDEIFGFLVADVAGHDLSSTYITGALKALTATFTNECLSISDTMIMLNAGLFKFLDETQYVTATYAKFDRATMAVDLICAGHPAPLYLPRGGTGTYLELIGDALGLCEQTQFDTRRITVAPGDRLWLFTDGLTEAFPDADGRMGNRLVGMEQLARLLRDRQSAPIPKAVKSTVDELLAIHQGSLEDDVVLIGVEF